RLATQLRQRYRYVDCELMRRRVLTVVQAGAATVAQIRQIAQIARRERPASLHRREHGAQSLAVPARVADDHQTFGFLPGSGECACSHASARPPASRPAMRPNTPPMVMPTPAA